MTKKSYPLGIDVGGTGIKGAPVDLDTGEFVADRLRIDTPEGATPGAVADVIAEIVEHFSDLVGDEPIGVTIPGVVQHGVVRTAANIDPAWIDTNAEELIAARLGRRVTVVNDADAAGYAEIHYGAAKDRDGLVVVTTLGTGIGAAIVYDGTLVPNAELGHLWLELEGGDPPAVHAESWAANSAREREDLGWEEWAARLTVYYRTLEKLFSPDLIVVGGGVSKKADKFLPLVEVTTPLVPATLRNAAGIVGAALAASRS